MSRPLSAESIAAVTSASLRPVMLYEGVWASATVRLWTGIGDLTWNGQTWQGIGTFLGISEIVETAETRIEGVDVSLSGVPLTEISKALGQSRTGLAGALYFGVMDDNGTVVADEMFRGRMDVVAVREESGDICTLSVRYLSRLADMRKASARRYTDEDLQNEFAGDKGLEYLASIQDAQIEFGGGWRWPGKVFT